MSAIILLDTSGSMALPVGTERRIDVLGHILAAVQPKAHGAHLFSFNDEVVDLDNAVTDHGMNLPTPWGGTALAEALTTIAPLKPSLLLVISDGEPNDPRAAITAATALGCVVQTFYCGDESNRAAVSFLRDLWAPTEKQAGVLRRICRKTGVPEWRP